MKIDLYEFLIDKGYGPHCSADLVEAYDKGGIRRAVKEASTWDNSEEHKKDVRGDIEEWRNK